MYSNEQHMLQSQNLCPDNIFPEMLNKTKPRIKLSGGTYQMLGNGLTEWHHASCSTLWFAPNVPHYFIPLIPIQHSSKIFYK